MQTRKTTMKKLLILITTAFVAITLQAANFVWGNGSYDYTGPNGETDYTGGKAFLFLGTITVLCVVINSEIPSSRSVT